MEQKSLDIIKFKLNQPALIEASAGTGKTYTITNLVLRILLGSGDQNNSLERPLPIENLLVVTFTRVATSDLRRRIYERIRMARVLFENFLETAKQELANKAQELASKELKNAERAAKAATKLKEQGISDNDAKLLAFKEQESLLNQLDPSLTEEERIEQFCELFINNESFDSKLREKLAKFQLNVETIAREKLKCDDAFLIQLLKQIADKDALKQAIGVLIRAERSIDDAAICTIHSFCNRTLTQIYAFEANEAFSNELSNDLSLQYQDAANTVWRKLFYKLSATPAVLKLLGISTPQQLSEVKNNIDSVHLSQEQAGVFGYELLNFNIPGFKQSFDIAQDYDLEDILQRLFYRAEIFDLALDGIRFNCYKQWRDKHITQVEQFIDLKNKQAGPLLCPSGKALTFVKEGVCFVEGLCLIEDTYHTLEGNSEFQSLLQQNALLADKLLKADYALDCSELQAIYASFKQFNLPQVFASTNLIEAVDSLLNSNYDNKSKDCIFARRSNESKALAASQEYQDFHASIFKLVSSLSAINNSLNDLKQVISVLLSMQINQQLQDYCIENHLMSNDDLLRRLDQALQRPGFGDRLAHLIRMRYPLAMIDEFQDTDPIQYSIFSKIYLNKTALKEKAYCYLIGDPKQSIYAFRGSDINSYLKARHAIKQLTNSKGISTLNVNYRSTDDVINACNALFYTTLNPENASPFKELDIPFEPVGSNKKRKSAIEVEASEAASKLNSLPVDSVDMAKAWGSSFVIEHMQDFGLISQGKAQEGAEAPSNVATASENATDKESATTTLALDKAELKLPQALANSYVVKFPETYKKKDLMLDDYAKATAFLIQKILKEGRIIEKGEERAVKPSDIALLVRSQSQSDLLQKTLKDLGISSVYFSDRSSVLIDGNGAPTKESNDILYLMEAMSDPANRSKVMRVLGSGLLSLNTDEFLEHCSGLAFEKEVLCLRNCAQVWDKYGFMPAFMQWCQDSSHQVTARLLSILNGERALTNYNQISELIQGAHNLHSSIQAQIRWFYDMLFSGQQSIDAESAQKRLDSEHEQIKILTIHKSKGLEFPIVFMPFLWVGVSNFIPDSNKLKLNAAKYYSNDVKQRVLDFKDSSHIIVPDVSKIALDKLKHELAENHEVEYDFAEFEQELNKEAELQFVSDDDEILDEGAEDTEGENDSFKAEDATISEDVVAPTATQAQTKSDEVSRVVPDVSLERLAAIADSDAGNSVQGQSITHSMLTGQEDSENSLKSKRPYLLYAPKGYEKYENAKESMRLLYVAVTRARLANFFFIADYKQDKGVQPQPSALMELLGIKKISEVNLLSALEPLERKPQLFTMVDGKRCLDLFNKSVKDLHFQASNLTLSSSAPENQERMYKIQAKIDNLLPVAKEQGESLRKEFEAKNKYNRKQGNFKNDLPFKIEGQVAYESKLYEQICILRQELELLKVNNVPVLDSSEGAPFESCAMSFAYDGMVDNTFNIMSYSGITHGRDPVKKAQMGQRNIGKHTEEEDGALDVQGAVITDSETPNTDAQHAVQESSDWIKGEQTTGVGSLVGGNCYYDYAPESNQRVEQMKSYNSIEVLTQNYTLNEYVQYHWDAGQRSDHGCWAERPCAINFSFPCGAEPGTFLHESLRYVKFGEIQTTDKSKENFFDHDLKDHITLRSDLGPIYRKANLDIDFTRFSDWMINMVEAPILKGRYQNLALADLQEGDYHSEMNFLMTSKRFDTRQIDELCKKMARKILPTSMQGIIDDLVLTQDERFGFITGSIDLACRFDLNYQGDLRYRKDLLNELSKNERNIFEARAQEDRAVKAEVEPDYKYYVIDYKSNILGSDFGSYSTQNMLNAIYSHRYDVQFLFYTLAIFRLLKRRMGLSFDAAKEEQRKLYDAHMGGVIYLYLRGLKGDYLRRNISPGVFSIKIDFEFVYDLDQIFGADEEWS